MQTVEQVKEALEKREPVTSLASLVRVAIEDGREMLKRKRVRPSYSTWCTTRESYKPPHPDATNEEIALAQDDDQQFECFVCLGGAVLIGAVGFNPFVNGLYQAKEPHHFDIATSDAMRALDQVRQGSVTMAYCILGLAPNDLQGREEFVRAHRAHRDMHFVEHKFFVGRDEFGKHLDSLDGLADRLEAFEAEYFAEDATE